MKFIRTRNNAAGKAVIAENRELPAVRAHDFDVPSGPGGRWLVVEFEPGQSTGWHAVHCDVYVYIAKGELATSNAQQVEKMRGILEALSLELATPAEARAYLGLKGGDRVGF